MACLGVEREADEPNRAAVGKIGLGVFLLAYLLEGLVHRFVHLQLEDVDALLVLRHDVGASVRLPVLRDDLDPLRRKKRVEDTLVRKLLDIVLLWPVWQVRVERLEAYEELRPVCVQQRLAEIRGPYVRFPCGSRR